MFAYIFNTSQLNVVTVVGIAIIFFACFVTLKAGLGFLPGDGGRDVTGGSISKGKPTGAGIIMILAFDAEFYYLPDCHLRPLSISCL